MSQYLLKSKRNTIKCHNMQSQNIELCKISDINVVTV